MVHLLKWSGLMFGCERAFKQCRCFLAESTATYGLRESAAKKLGNSYPYYIITMAYEQGCVVVHNMVYTLQAVFSLAENCCGVK